MPAILKWPQKILPNTLIVEPTSLMDFFPTLKDIVPNSPTKSTYKVYTTDIKRYKYIYKDAAVLQLTAKLIKASDTCHRQ